MNKVTISDIAKELGVTPSTVSRALAGNKRVSLKTRERVKRVADEMGYQPNLMAASLRKGTSDLVGMIVPRINRHFFSNVISGVEEVLNPAGFSLLIMQSQETYDVEVKAVNSLLQNRVAGIITSLSAQSESTEHFQPVSSAKLPIVQFDRVSNSISGCRIKNDNIEGCYKATESLLKSGYRKLAFLGGSELLETYRERKAGFEKAVHEYPEAVEILYQISDSITREAGRANVKEAIANGADAVVCAGDYAAMGVLEYLKELGDEFIDGFGFVGFGNEPFAEMTSPTISTVEQNGREVGRMVAQQMIKAIGGEEINTEIVIPVEYIERESSSKKEKIAIYCC